MKKNIGFLFVIPSLVGLVIFYIIPSFDILLRSFMKNGFSNFIGLYNYETVIQNKAFQMAVLNTLRLMLVCIPLLVLLSLLIIMIFEFNSSLTKLIKNLFMLPLAIPVTSVALLWEFCFNRSGLLNSFLDIFKIDAIDWMNSKHSFYILVFIYIWRNIGYCTVLWLAGLSAISVSIVEAAKVDGANKLICMIKIKLPNLSRTLYIILVLSIINLFKVFREIYLITGNYPHKSIYLMQNIFNNWFVDLEIGKLSAGAEIFFVLTIITIAICLVTIKRKE